MAYKNKERRSANVSLIIMVIGILAAALPFILNVDMVMWGFGVAFIGGTTALITFFVFLMFNGRAGVRERMFRDENILARWQYSKEFWEQEYKEDMKDSGIGKIVGFFFGGIFTLIGIIFFAIDTEENVLILLIMLGIAVFFIIIGFISSGAEKRRINSSLPEAIIAQEGLFFKNILYTWNSRAISYLESVTMHPTQPTTILFVLRQLSGGGLSMTRYRQFFIEIPIPLGQEQTAFSIIQYFNIPMTQENVEKMQQEENLEKQID